MRLLSIRGARQHNLKDIDCDLPRDQLVVFTGPSGSGKSSLAFDTIYAEGQRRYVESLSAYARQFLEQLPKPNVESIEGLSPAIAIEQRSLGRSPRSTVGTVTEIADYLRLIFARAGTPHCPKSGVPLVAYTAQQMVDLMLERPEGSRVIVLAPLVRDRVGALTTQLEDLRKGGFVRVRIDGKLADLGEEPDIDEKVAHNLDVVVDRLTVKQSAKGRMTDSVELALKMGQGTLFLDFVDDEPPLVLSERLISWEYGIEIPALEPKLFSFNSPHGACPQCKGLGEAVRPSIEHIVPDPDATLREGALAPFGPRGSVAASLHLDALVKALGADPDKRWSDLDEKLQGIILDGGELRGKGRKVRRYVGVIPQLEQWMESGPDEDGEAEDGELSRDELARFFVHDVCTSCGGQRLRAEALSVKLAGSSIAALGDSSLGDLYALLQDPSVVEGLSADKRHIAEPLLHAVAERLSFLIGVGLNYLSLNRPVTTLSSGEAQRIRLATQIGASLSGVLYVLDEPSAGLHPKDNANLLVALRRLVDRGNSVIVVEHDRETILAADYVVDLGPAAGELGGEIVAQGTPQEIMAAPGSITGPFLKGSHLLAHQSRRQRGKTSLRVQKASLNNLRDVTVEFPLGLMIAVTGVSGSGKSSLVVDTLLAEARRALYGSKQARAQAKKKIRGLEHIDKVVGIDQAPIGRSPRSNPATFTGIFAALRELFASLAEARARGYKPGRFSFNVKGGRCEACQGDGLRRVEMHFLPDVYVECEQCGGQRYNRETLEVRYRGYSIADVLQMSVDDASELLQSIPRLDQRLQALRTAGLGYLRLGQPAPTLSGGEAQRIKLAAELSRKATGSTLYVLDEPTTGLHFRDVEMLYLALDALVQAGNTVVLIEHNLDLAAAADWVIDLGPDGGKAGGEIVAEGPPSVVAKAKHGHTARYLAEALAS